MTSDEEFEQVLEKCKSRFFDTSYITKVIFTVGEPLGSFVGVYENNAHLKEVSEKLKRILI